MELRQLHHFQVIAQQENLTKASELLFISQPNLSRELAILESELGAPLFRREKGKKLALNQNGQLLLNLCLRIFPEIENTVHKIQQQGMEKVSTLRISMAATCMVNECITKFHRYYPEVLIYQTFCSTSQLNRLLLQKETDLGITFDDYSEPQLAMVELGEFSVAVAVSQKHPLAERSSVSLKELIQYRVLCNETGINHKLTEQIFLKAGLRPREAIILQDNYLINQHMEHTDYVTLFPLEMENQEIPLKTLKIEDCPITVKLKACFNRTQTMSDVTQQMLQQMISFYHGS